MHGESISLPTGQNHFHIVTSVGPIPVITPGEQWGMDADATIKTREGMYSRVRGTLNFEWDGWRGHDG